MMLTPSSKESNGNQINEINKKEVLDDRKRKIYGKQKFRPFVLQTLLNKVIKNPNFPLISCRDLFRRIRI